MGLRTQGCNTAAGLFMAVTNQVTGEGGIVTPKQSRGTPQHRAFTHTQESCSQPALGSRLTLLVLAILLLAASATAMAQFSSGLQGSVQDASGVDIPSASVTLNNVDTGVSQTANADSGGVYRFASLVPGKYLVAATVSGFNASKTEFTLSTNETRNVPIILTVGAVSSAVSVTTQQPLLDTSDSRNQLTIDTKALDNLPLAARNPLALITLAPGVTGLGTGNPTNFSHGNSVDASANGRGSNGNLYVVDGLDVTCRIRPGV